MRTICVAMLLVMLIAAAMPAYAQGKKGSDILKEGILGAGAGAVGGAASGARGKNLWKGALAGAGVNVVGGAILDSMSGEKVTTVDSVQSMPAQDAFNRGYEAGFSNGYKQGHTEGYTQGYKEGLKEGISSK